jgi:hypothetical protein
MKCWRSCGVKGVGGARLVVEIEGRSISKSTQSLNSRYAGVRKASAAQRSPLNFTFADSGSVVAIRGGGRHEMLEVLRSQGRWWS